MTACPALATTVTGVQTVPGIIQFVAVACGSPTTCVAVGYGSGNYGAVTLTNGTPGAVQVVTGVKSLRGVACPNATTCLAVGSQSVPRPGQRPGSQGVVVPITNGIVGPPQPAPAVAALDAIACSSDTTCYASGTALGGVGQVITITNGIPGSAQAISEGIGLSALACQSVTTCYAVGSSADGGVLVPIVNGTPGAPQSVLAAAFLTAIACSSDTICYATGTSADFSQAVLVPITNGNPGDPLYGASFGAIACPNTTTCVLVGLDPTSGMVQVVLLVNGMPGAALVLPGSNAYDAVACSSATVCEAVGGNNASQIGVVATITVPPPCTTTVTANRVGTLVTGSGLTCLSGMHLAGNVIVPRGASLRVESSTVTGSILATSPNAVQLCGSTVGGSVTVRGAGGFVLIGDPGDDGCAPNRIAGSLIVQNNTHGLDAIANHVRGAVMISGNSGAGPFPEDTAPDIAGNGR